MLVSVQGRQHDLTHARSAVASQSFVPTLVWDNEPAVKLLNILNELDLLELRLELDVDLGSIWCFQQHRGGVSFSPRLLKDIQTVQRALHDFHRAEPIDAGKIAKFLIWASDAEDVFNLGGELRYFEQLVKDRDQERLRAYAMSCVDVCYSNYCALQSPMIVAALVQGDALGGGMESALSCDFILAEEQSKFGLPEMLYGLFPGMGAYSFLMRRVGQAKAEQLISQGDLQSAEQMAELGLVEKVVAKGTGRDEMNRQLAKVRRRFNATLAVYNARRRAFPVTYQELADIADEWVSVALRLTDHDLRRMNKLSTAQNRIRQNAAARALEADTA